MKLWGRTNSMNVQKVMWTLGELDMPYERIDAGGPFGLTDTGEYRTMNPNGRIPVLQDGDFVLWESNAIVRYLCRQYDSPLCPDTPRALALADQWMDWAATEFRSAIHPVFHALVRNRLPPDGRAGVERGLEEMDARLAVLNGALANTPFLAGEVFTMADIPAGLTVARWNKMPVEKRTVHAAVDLWFAEISARPAFRAQVDLPIS